MNLMKVIFGWSFFILLIINGCTTGHSPFDTPFINGVSLVAPKNKVTSEIYDPIKKINANWVAIIPYSFIKKGTSKVHYNFNGQWWGESIAGVKETILQARDKGLSVMLKPHSWVGGVGWPGDFNLVTEDEWLNWEKSYEAYIMTFAESADRWGVKLFCIGTEYRHAAIKRPAFWIQLIEKIRTVYNGKLTYAANWDSYDKIIFWSALDYIGIDAYFPLDDAATPEVKTLVKKWEPHKIALSNFSKKFEKPIIFTEFGYRSINHSAGGHWKIQNEEEMVNQKAQSNAYEAIFELWNAPWFKGGFVWKWHPAHHEVGGTFDTQFTPQNKLAEKIIGKQYLKYATK